MIRSTSRASSSRMASADQIATSMREQESVAVWDDAVINARAGNQAMDDRESRRLDVDLLRSRPRLRAGPRRPARSMPCATARRCRRQPRRRGPRHLVAPSVAEAPRLARQADARRRDDPAESGGRATWSCWTASPAILSVVPLVPSSRPPDPGAGQRISAHSVQFMDRHSSASIAAPVPAVGRPAAACSTAAPDWRQCPAGRIRTAPSWAISPGIRTRPGMTLVQAGQPARRARLAARAGVLCFLLRRLRRASVASCSAARTRRSIWPSTTR